MKVLYDHQIFEHQRIGGVSRYFSEIIKHLPTSIEAEISIRYSFNEYLRNTNISFEWKDYLLSYDNFLPQINFKGKKRLQLYAEKYLPSKYPNFINLNKEESIRKLIKGDFDIFHPTFFDDYFLDYIGNKPYVLTVHDMIIELYPEFINSPGFVKRKKKLIDNAAHIIAVSENTKQDIINVFDTDPNKISITYHASSLDSLDKISETLPNKYLLYVGDRRLGYKNFSFFISSIQNLLTDIDDLYLVCTGEYFTNEELAFFEALGIKDKVKIIFVDDNKMFDLYHRAEMFIYPSYYEGFGIPILEAFQAECPVVLTNCSCFPEVAKDGGVYFNHKSPSDLRKSILELLNNKKYRCDVKEKGTNRLKKFSWEQSAQKTAEIYAKVLNIND